jgi:hypothetical protein
VAGRGSHAAQEALAIRWRIEERAGDGFGDAFAAGDFGAADAVCALYVQPAELRPRDERAAARGAVEDEVHGKFLAAVVPAR